MKVGHSVYYNNYCGNLEFLYIGGNVHVIDHDTGYLGYAKLPEDIYAICRDKIYNDDKYKEDILEAIGYAIDEAQEEKPYSNQ